ncbi:MAG TPA: hypothetical protein VLA72_08145 [Anaerolineales bacterium]|nr:hypothetical protein [Anaerolineales bacterium]
MNLQISNRYVSCNGHHDLKYSPIEMPSWWGGRLKALRRISPKDILDAAVVSVFFLAMSTLTLMPVAVSM